MTTEEHDLLTWLRDCLADYVFDVVALYKLLGEHDWPLTAEDEQVLAQQLSDGGHLLPLPKEPAALANIIEVSLVDFLLEKLAGVDGAIAQRGTERGYPDVEVGGKAFGGGFHAVDIKVARRGKTKSGKTTKTTQSKVTLYTGNTYFRYPQLHWSGTFRPFQEYRSHLVLIVVYTLDEDVMHRVTEAEVIIQPSWKVASKQRSSTTREYIGAVDKIEDLRTGNGSFATEEEFYSYWRKYPFKIGRTVQQQLDKLLKQQRGS